MKVEENFETEYALQQFREVQSEYFDEDGNCYTGVNLSPSMMESMLKLINMLEKANQSQSEELEQLKAVLRMVASNNLKYGKDSSRRRILRLVDEEWDLIKQVLKETKDQ
jgi:hypothetical protein